MSDESSTERQRNLWAPWRMEYIEGIDTRQDGCFLCHHRDDAANDAQNLVLWRGRRCMAVLNRFPYAAGHCMVAPLAHVGELWELDAATMCEMMCFLRDLQNLLTHSLKAEGYNIGINIGRCAGAGLPGHLHMHIVPRWRGDVNFITVFGDVRVIPKTLQAMYEQLARDSRELGLPDPACSQETCRLETPREGSGREGGYGQS